MNEIELLAKQLSFGEAYLQHRAISQAVEAGDELSRRLNLLADVAWSTIAEPGDEFIGYLSKTLGLPKALSLLVNQVSHFEWLETLQQLDEQNIGVARFSDLSTTVADSLERYRPRVSLASVLEKLDGAKRLGLTLVNREHSHWPLSLDALELGAPTMLWARGDTAALESCGRSVAVVGSRTPTQYGIDVTEQIVQTVAEQNFAVISGGAYGIDAAAHRFALAVQTPTVAVMAGGVDLYYPRGNQQLLDKISTQGVVISEVSLGTPPAKWRFLQRNRLIAALSQATFVVEAGYRSGAINTANHASAIGRPVGAVPGSILSPRSQGCHKLISDSKALLMGSMNDIMALAQSGDLATEVYSESLPALETRVFDAIGFSSITTAEICARAGLTAAEASLALASLEARGLTAQTMGRFERC